MGGQKRALGVALSQPVVADYVAASGQTAQELQASSSESLQVRRTVKNPCWLFIMSREHSIYKLTQHMWKIYSTCGNGNTLFRRARVARKLSAFSYLAYFFCILYLFFIRGQAVHRELD